MKLFNIIGEYYESLDENEVCDILNEIMEYELAGVVRYTHSSLMVSVQIEYQLSNFFKLKQINFYMRSKQGS